VSIPSLSLGGQVALITGARRGIGEACALTFAEAGADVAVCDIVADTGELAAVADKITGLGRRCLAIRADVKQKTEVNNMVKRVVEEFSTIDILVNNAGVGVGTRGPQEHQEGQARTGFGILVSDDVARMIDMAEENWDRVIDTNLKSCLFCSQAVSRVMIEKGRGNIINISSVLAYERGFTELSPYSVSKRGIVMLTEGLAAILGTHNIRVNAIAPGGIETEMMRNVMESPERLKRVESGMLLSNRLIKPTICANVALFLASKLSAYVTGQTIIVDAGLTLARQTGG